MGSIRGHSSQFIRHHPLVAGWEGAEQGAARWGNWDKAHIED